MIQQINLLIRRHLQTDNVSNINNYIIQLYYIIIYVVDYKKIIRQNS